MKFTDKELQNLRQRCLTAITYKRELAHADSLIAEFSADLQTLVTAPNELKTLLTLIDLAIEVRKSGVSKVGEPSPVTEILAEEVLQDKEVPEPVVEELPPTEGALIEEDEAKEGVTPCAESVIEEEPSEDDQVYSEDEPSPSPDLSETSSRLETPAEPQIEEPEVKASPDPDPPPPPVVSKTKKPKSNRKGS